MNQKEYNEVLKIISGLSVFSRSYRLLQDQPDHIYQKCLENAHKRLKSMLSSAFSSVELRGFVASIINENFTQFAISDPTAKNPLTPLSISDIFGLLAPLKLKAKEDVKITVEKL